ncbi:MAG TPA: methionyl-tRNA formyltransferase, partial [Thermomicrobiales bacterium]|nr:methionyl-tRNA formyltransferase [Thermomicrobiales bacterium]
NDPGLDSSQRPRVVFFGTPAFAVPSLRALALMVDIELSLVVTQPDRPAGRRQRLQASPVKAAAQDLGLPVYQPTSLRAAAVRERLASVGADVFVVAAYGQIFGPKMLALPRRGCINLHASLLPAYRGASPVSAAILAGEAVTGVSLMVMDIGLDTGPVLATAEEPIRHDDTTETLTTRLADRAAHLLVPNLAPYVRGELVARPQIGAATLTRPLVKADGMLDWTCSAVFLERQVRAMWPWPRAWTTVTIKGEPLTMQIHEAQIATGNSPEAGPPGTLVFVDDRAVVRCGSGRLALTTVQLPGGSPRPGRDLRTLALPRDRVILGAGFPAGEVPPLLSTVDSLS